MQRSSPQTAVCGEERCVTSLKTAAKETRGFYKTKKVKKCVKLYLNFQRGGGVRKNLFCGGGMGIF